MDKKSIEKLVKNMKPYGDDPNINYNQDNTHIKYNSVDITISKYDPIIVEFSIRIEYDLLFDQDNINYLNSKGIDTWSIYKHFLEFNYSPNDEQDLEDTIKHLLQTYNY